MVGSVSIGTKEIWFTAYNPSDALSRMYCAYVVGRVAETMDNTPVEEVHAWLRSRFPELSHYLDAVEGGMEPKREVPPGEYPMSPVDAKFEKMIIDFLIARKRGPR